MHCWNSRISIDTKETDRRRESSRVVVERVGVGMLPMSGCGSCIHEERLLLIGMGSDGLCLRMDPVRLAGETRTGTGSTIGAGSEGSAETSGASSGVLSSGSSVATVELEIGLQSTDTSELSLSSCVNSVVSVIDRPMFRSLGIGGNTTGSNTLSSDGTSFRMGMVKS